MEVAHQRDRHIVFTRMSELFPDAKQYQHVVFYTRGRFSVDRCSPAGVGLICVRDGQC